VFDLYNRTHTRKGAEVLERMFQNPLSDAQAINDRLQIIRYFTAVPAVFPFRTELFDFAELYLEMDDDRTGLSAEDNTLIRRLTTLVAASTVYTTIRNGVQAVIEILHTLQQFLQRIAATAEATPYAANIAAMRQLLDDPAFEELRTEKVRVKLSYAKLARYDKLLRFEAAYKIREILAYLYQLDVYFSVAGVAMQYRLAFPRALAPALQAIRMQGVYHPLVKQAIPNTIEITPDSNVVFLTGANMAGKSTFMKSIGIALFVAHVGFPVAAESMEFSVRDGIYTTINLPDNLAMGSSHFYAEVLRVKKMAREASLNKNLFIIFDELFRGTNVKDAYEATVAITEAFAQKRNCMFVVSTHIIEAGEVLREKCRNINFTYLPTRMNGNVPVYTYTLEKGITADRHGMVIINNEGIIDIIQSRKSKPSLS
ncbi:MAG TPA: DNA mismatch repair protein, partial [Chitinophaga sp.]